MECENKGIKLIHIFENEWNNKNDIIKSKLKHILNINNTLPKIYARKCIVKKIISTEKDLFLLKNHIQGKDVSSIRYGLFYNDLLISVMTFTKPNISKGNSSKIGIFELNRFCNDINYNVIGSFGKLLKSFIMEYNPLEIFTYANRRYTSKYHNVYTKNNFSEIQPSPPNYYYTNDYKNLLNRFNFTKHKILQMGGNPSISEWENMKLFGYDRIWDCGNLKYILKLQ